MYTVMVYGMYYHGTTVIFHNTRSLETLFFKLACQLFCCLQCRAVIYRINKHPISVNVLLLRLLLIPQLLSASSFCINGEYSVADDLGPYLHNTEQAELIQFTTQD